MSEAPPSSSSFSSPTTTTAAAAAAMTTSIQRSCHKKRPHHTIRLLLHGEDGAIPLLSPYLLRTYFHPTDHDYLVQNHFILGVSIKDSCVVPVYRTDDDGDGGSGKKSGGGSRSDVTKKSKRAATTATKEDRPSSAGAADAKNVREDREGKKGGQEDKTNERRACDAASCEGEADGRNRATKKRRRCAEEEAATDAAPLSPGAAAVAVARSSGPMASKECKDGVGERRDDDVKRNHPTTTATKAKKTAAATTKKPSGYTFVPKHVHSYLRVPPSYKTLAVPTFDPYDDAVRSKDSSATITTTAAAALSSPSHESDATKAAVVAPVWMRSTRNEMTLCTPNGRQKITPELYATVAATGRGLSCSEGMVAPFVDVFAEGGGGKRRKATAVERTADWLDRTWNAVEGGREGVLGQASSSVAEEGASSVATTKIWCPIVGGDDPSHWTESARAVTARLATTHHRGNNSTKDDEEEEGAPGKHGCKNRAVLVGGAVLVGWHRITDRTVRLDVLRRCLEELRGGPPSVKENGGCGDDDDDDFGNATVVPVPELAILAANDVQTILDAASNGISIVGTGLPAILARRHRALVFDVAGTTGRRSAPASASETEVGPVLSTSTRSEGGSDGGGGGGGGDGDGDGCIDLSDACHARVGEVLVPGCACPSCRDGRYSRAYVHHLVHAKELLAEILLFGHNLHRLLLLMRELSRAVEEGSGEEFCRRVKALL